jgi:S-DNA-T family DNA segregation ATPase FtsK/SpoIIIE
VVGIAFLIFAFIAFLGLASPSRGVLTEALIRLLRLSLGVGAYISPFILGVIGIWLILKGLGREPKFNVSKAFGAGMLFALLLASVHLLHPTPNPKELAIRGGGGGYLGYLLSQALIVSIGHLGTYITIVSGIGISLVMLLGLSIAEMGLAFGRGWRGLKNLYSECVARYKARRARQAPPPRKPILPRIIGEERWRLPKISEILEESSEKEISQAEIRRRARLIEETLASFGVPVKVVEVNQGPAVTQFGVEPGFIEHGEKRIKVKVSKISSLADDLALALAASPVRIEAPVPGKSIVGIEVPNPRVSLVALRGVMESEEFLMVKSKLAIALGRDISGRPVAADLARMPHLLIAGATGSGKSVCINSIATCLLCNNTPDDLRLLMIDPKRVELVRFDGVPHLLSPVVVDLERAISTLKWVMQEMDSRYRRFSREKARNIEEYNQRVSPDRRLPRIVVMIDELSDLMMLAPEDVERLICRIAQMGRATGIHLVIATQRPSVDIVTGLIKANFPTRISFATTSQVDSRVILDIGGAERLLGRGDMLYLAPDSSKPLRLQGCFVSDRELSRLINYWKGFRMEVAYPTATLPVGEFVETIPLFQPPSYEFKAKGPLAQRQDDLLEEAIELVHKHKRVSISLLQRKLRIGYSRAARLIELLEELGITERKY